MLFSKAYLKTRHQELTNDHVPYEFISNLDENNQKLLLDVYNNCWKNSSLPTSWKQAIILPFSKKGKNPALPTSYRPISLLSNVGKILEKLLI